MVLVLVCLYSYDPWTLIVDSFTTRHCVDGICLLHLRHCSILAIPSEKIQLAYQEYHLKSFIVSNAEGFGVMYGCRTAATISRLVATHSIAGIVVSEVEALLM